jgi:hypothetical protein
MNADKLEQRENHLAPVEVRRRIVRVIVRSAREEAGLPVRPKGRFPLARKLRAWRRRAMPLF